MAKQTKSSKPRTKVKDLPKQSKELNKKEQQKVKGGASPIKTFLCPSDSSAVK